MCTNYNVMIRPHWVVLKTQEKSWTKIPFFLDTTCICGCVSNYANKYKHTHTHTHTTLLTINVQQEEQVLDSNNWEIDDLN